MKKIAIYLGVLGNGGIESATVSQFLHFDKSILSVDFIVDSLKDCNSQYTTVINNNGGRIIPIVLGEDRGFLSKIVLFHKLLKKERYDVIHIQASYPSTLLYCVIASFSGITNRIATSHAQGTAIESRIFNIYQSICRAIYPLFCSKRIAVSNVAGKWLYGQYQFVVIPNAIDTKLFKFNYDIRCAYRQKLAITTEKLIGHVGRFGPDKNHEMILRVFCIYFRRNHNSKLLLIGDGPLHDKIEEMAKELGIYQSVIFIRQTPEVNKYMQAMDVLLMPSLREACSVVVMEAQATGLPVLASDTIPLENKISGIMFYDSLLNTPEHWADLMDSIIQIDIKREDIVIHNGDYPCDIKDLSKVIQNQFYN